MRPNVDDPMCYLIGADGNLVASLLAHSLNIPQANIAHALEKASFCLS